VARNNQSAAVPDAAGTWGDTAADEWFGALPAAEHTSLAVIRTAFLKRWSSAKRPKLSRVEQRARIKDQGLKEEDVES